MNSIRGIIVIIFILLLFQSMLPKRTEAIGAPPVSRIKIFCAVGILNCSATPTALPTATPTPLPTSTPTPTIVPAATPTLIPGACFTPSEPVDTWTTPNGLCTVTITHRNKLWFASDTPAVYSDGLPDCTSGFGKPCGNTGTGPAFTYAIGYRDWNHDGRPSPPADTATDFFRGIGVSDGGTGLGYAHPSATACQSTTSWNNNTTYYDHWWGDNNSFNMNFNAIGHDGENVDRPMAHIQVSPACGIGSCGTTQADLISDVFCRDLGCIAPNSSTQTVNLLNCPTPTITPTLYTLTGNVYADNNNNGVKDAGDTNLNGITVNVSGVSSATTTSDSSGNYSFPNLSPGNYTVSVTVAGGWQATTSNPVSITLSSNLVENFGIAQLVTISGKVFNDQNLNGILDSGETTYIDSPIVIQAGGTIASSNTGNYQLQVLPGSYIVSYRSGVPVGFYITEPVNGPPPAFSVTVGQGCSIGSSKNGGCDANGSIINLDFGITNTGAWMQGVGLDMLSENGFVNSIPQNPNPSCGGAVTSVDNSSTPGILFSGSSPNNFGKGQASSKNWIVGGSTYNYPDYFSTATTALVKSSYDYLLAKANSSGTLITPLPCDQTTCDLPNNGTFKDGVYQVTGDLTLNSYTFTGNNNYVILVSGKMIIMGQISIQAGSTVMFAVKGNIYVDKSVGAAASCPPTSQLDGFYSTQNSFVIQGDNNCNIGPDLMLNMAGSLIVNGGGTGGSLQVNRTLCNKNLQYPVFTITPRPDLILNAPDFLKQQNYMLQEVAP